MCDNDPLSNSRGSGLTAHHVFGQSLLVVIEGTDIESVVVLKRRWLVDMVVSHVRAALNDETSILKVLESRKKCWL
jgi:hypothetical protein